MISTNQIYYVAGVLEGEGCFTYGNTPIIILNMTDKDIVERVRNIISSKCIIYRVIKREVGHKFQYNIRVHATVAIQWMMTLYSLMGERRKEEIKKVIDEWRNKIQRSSDNNLCRYGHPNVTHRKDFYYRLDGSKRCRYCRKLGVA